jgi:predicted transcriptional regulator
MNIILSIHPKWAKLIYEGKKTIEWRKTTPKRTNGFTKIFLYETAPVCKITGYVLFYGYDIFSPKQNCLKFENGYALSNLEQKDAIEQIVRYGRVSMKDLVKYQGTSKQIFAWVVNAPRRANCPMPIADFGIKRPPQSWCYTEVDV